MQWNKMIFPIIQKKYIDTHKAKIIFVNTPIPSHGKDSYLGSLALETIYQQDNEAFNEMMDQLYKYQKSPNKPWVTKQLIFSIAKNIKGVDFNQFKKDLNNKKFDGKLQEDIQISKKAKIDSTPTLLINNKRVETVINTENGKKIMSNPFSLSKINVMINKESKKN